MSNKSNVEIQITLQFENQYSGDGNTEPTREQVREALIDFANNNLTYSEKRTPISPEKGDAFDVHNDIVTGYYEQHKLDERLYMEPNAIEKGLYLLDKVDDSVDNNRTLSKNHYLLNEEPVNTPLETFNDMDDALEQTYSIQRKAKTIGRDSKEQGGNRELGAQDQYNTDRDPLNED